MFFNEFIRIDDAVIGRFGLKLLIEQEWIVLRSPAGAIVQTPEGYAFDMLGVFFIKVE
ncbi:hypothetical protein D3C81_2160990 [compost metagenome]